MIHLCTPYKYSCVQGSYDIALLELFNIVYLGRDIVTPEKQNGTIRMTFDCCGQYIKVDTRQPSIEYMDDIVVPIKAPAIFYTEFDMEFDLFDGAYQGSFNFEWEPCENDISYWDERIISKDGLGEISVLYGLFGNATVADIKVELLENFDGRDVYGVVAASNSKLDRPACVSTLFVKKPDNMTKVGDGGLIPLSRSRVGVPLNSKLYIAISLHINGVQYRSKVEFVAEKQGECKKSEEFDCPGKEAVIRVTVTWDTDRESIESLYDFANED